MKKLLTFFILFFIFSIQLFSEDFKGFCINLFDYDDQIKKTLIDNGWEYQKTKDKEDYYYKDTTILGYKINRYIISHLDNGLVSENIFFDIPFTKENIYTIVVDWAINHQASIIGNNDYYYDSKNNKNLQRITLIAQCKLVDISFEAIEIVNNKYVLMVHCFISNDIAGNLVKDN